MELGTDDPFRPHINETKISFVLIFWESFSHVWQNNPAPHLNKIVAHYFVLLTILPWNVWIPSIFLSGLLSAIIVIPTHQSEAFFTEYHPDFATAQFMSTLNAVTTNPAKVQISKATRNVN